MKWLVAIFVFVAQRNHALHVQDFGAFPNDDADDTQAIQAALDALNPAGDVLEFSPGEYLISGQQGDHNKKGLYVPLLTLTDCANVHIRGNGALLNGVRNWGAVWFMWDVINVTLQDLSFDWEYALPFTSGSVVEEGRVRVNGKDFGFVDIQVVEPHIPPLDNVPALAFLQYDPLRQRPAEDGYDHYQTNADDNGVPNCEALSDSIMRCYKQHVNNDTPVGSSLIVRHVVYNYSVLTLWSSANVTIRNVNIYASPSGGLFAWDVENLHISHVAIRPPPQSQRWMSSNSDGLHINAGRGSLTIENSHFEGLGDDAINSHNDYMRIANGGHQQAGASLLLTWARDNDQIQVIVAPRVGDTLQLSRNAGKTPYQSQLDVVVQQVLGYQANGSLHIVVHPPIHPSLFESDSTADDDDGMILVLNLSNVPSQTVVRHCQFRRIRARGVLLMNQNVTVQHCHFQDITGPAIKMSTEDHFYEGIPAQNVLIRDCTFIENNYGTAQKGGTITTYARSNGKQASASVLYHNITMEHNEFVIHDGHAALWLAASNDVTFRNNLFSSQMGSPTNDARKSPIVYVDASCGTNVYADVPSVRAAPHAVTYSQEFGSSNSNRWQYLWNREGPIGRYHHYVPLEWDNELEIYDVNGDQSNDETGLVYGFLGDNMGHPGRGVGQGEATNRFVIAAWTVPMRGPYLIQNSYLRATDAACGNGNEVRVYVNNDLQLIDDTDNDEMIDFDVDMGLLEAGDTVYVAVGPHGDDACDYFTFDFSIVGREQVVPASVFIPSSTCPDTSNVRVAFMRKRHRRRQGIVQQERRRSVRCKWINKRNRRRRVCNRHLADDASLRVKDICRQECGICTPED